MYGLYSRAASNQERPMMARVRYSIYRIGIIQQNYMDHILINFDPPATTPPRVEKSGHFTYHISFITDPTPPFVHIVIQCPPKTMIAMQVESLKYTIFLKLILSLNTRAK